MNINNKKNKLRNELVSLKDHQENKRKPEACFQLLLFKKKGILGMVWVAGMKILFETDVSYF